jgi:hypothetical protein
LQAGSLRSPEKMQTPQEKQPLFPITLRIIVDDATLVDCGGVDLRRLSSGAD